MRAVEHSIPWPSVQLLLNELLEALNRFDCAAVRELLMQAVAEYRPMQDIQDHVWQRKQLAANVEAGKVTDLSARRARVHGQGLAAQ
jgi:hypothetical protein